MSDIGNLIFPTRNPTVYYPLSIASAGRVAFANNVGATSMSGTQKAAGTYRADVSILATVLATLAANTAFNIITTDAVGAVTTPVPLWANGAFGASFNMGPGGFQRAAGSLLFSYRGAGGDDISFSITGITTPGALAASYQWALTRVD
jgi:hypothetical protein